MALFSILLEMLGGILMLTIVIMVVWCLLADGDVTLIIKSKWGADPGKLRDQVVWITGASSGIGEYLAYDLARLGCRLILSARRQEELERVKKHCIVSGRIDEDNILVLPFDIEQQPSHEGIVCAAVQHFRKIDVLINNCGRTQRGLFIDTPMTVHNEILSLNTASHMSLTLALLPHLIQRKRGHIVVTNSVSGKLGESHCGTYVAAKHALVGWCDSLRLELYRHNILVTSLYPGPVQSAVVRESFTTRIGEKYNEDGPNFGKRMQTSRCSELMTVAIVNNLEEAWITAHPWLFWMYTAQYTPQLHKWLRKMYHAVK